MRLGVYGACWRIINEAYNRGSRETLRGVMGMTEFPLEWTSYHRDRLVCHRERGHDKAEEGGESNGACRSTERNSSLFCP